MAKHTIKAHMEVAASASMGKRRKPDVIAEIAAASRAVDQMKCADSHERFAQRVMAAMQIVLEAARASTPQVEPAADVPQVEPAADTVTEGPVFPD